jgi:hypothetical protein
MRARIFSSSKHRTDALTGKFQLKYFPCQVVVDNEAARKTCPITNL